jgi:hypothetical protein
VTTWWALVTGSLLIAFSAAWPTIRLSSSRLTPWWMVGLCVAWIAIGGPALAWGGQAKLVASWLSLPCGIGMLIGARITVDNRLRTLASAAVVDGVSLEDEVGGPFLDMASIRAIYDDAKTRLEGRMESDPAVKARVEQYRKRVVLASRPPLARA